MQNKSIYGHFILITNRVFPVRIRLLPTYNLHHEQMPLLCMILLPISFTDACVMYDSAGG